MNSQSTFTPILARYTSRLLPMVLVMAAAVVALELATLGPRSIDRVVVVASINMILALGIYAFSGNSGVISFGQLAFAAIGAYTAGLFRMPLDQKDNLLPDLPKFIQDTQLSSLEATLLGGAVAAAVAALLAIPLMRLTGLSAGLASLSLLFIVQVVARSWEQVTRGGKGLSAIPTTVTNTTALVWVLVTIGVIFIYQLTSAGLRLRTSREDEVASRAIGVDIGRERGISFVLSGFFMGIGGGLYAQFIGAVDPDFFFITLTFLIITMMVIGGFTSVAGAVVGAVVVSAIAELLRRAETSGVGGFDFPLGLQDLVIAFLLFVIILVRPHGLTKGKEFTVGAVDRWNRKWAHPPLVEPKNETPTPPASD